MSNERDNPRYDNIACSLPKGKRKLLKQEAAKRGTSVSKLIIYALEQTYKIDLSK